ncbi:bifunctional chorismate mutase/prephenate dehydratase [Thermodesulfobacteriota bacterium]
MSLKEIRKRIDLLDSGILKALNDRMELALMAKKFKSNIEDSVREKELLDRIRRNSTGLINAEFVEKIYIEIINESKALQKKDHNLIAFYGEHGAYGEVASREWNSDWVPVPCKEFASVFEGVKTGNYDYGIVPVENTLGGVVGEVNELLVSTDLYVIGAVELPIYLCLLILPGTDHREIHTVYSNSQVLAQCRNFLMRNSLEPVQHYDSAGAAKMLAEKTPKSSAVIASKLSAEIYDLEIIKEDIDDFDKNVTRFLVLSKEENKEEGDKCSIIFSIEHRAGSLFSVLEVFARENINLTRIGSIQSSMGSYAFFLDFLGSSRDKNIIKVIKNVEKVTTDFRFMGCYKERIL